MWVVSPWVSDIPILDNGAHAFLSLEPSWSRGPIRLSQVLMALADRGTTVRVATRPDPHNRPVLEALEGHARVKGAPIFVQRSAELHAKGILADRFYIGGSMNFTYNGITLNEEAVHYETDHQVVAERHVLFSDRWGGAQ
jgi:phosphatidylserine/phosphatidylglycerophosphate/cardiolipin synthase-like enzyme